MSIESENILAWVGVACVVLASIGLGIALARGIIFLITGG